MADMSSLAGSAPTLAHPSTFAPVASLDFPVGTPIYVNSGGESAKAQASGASTVQCAGLARSQGILGERHIAQYGDVLKLTTEEWDAVGTSSAGLTPGALYYLSAATAGLITATAPVSEGAFVAPLGLALSATELRINIQLAVVVP